MVRRSWLSGDQADEIRAIIASDEEHRLFETEGKLIALLPLEEMGRTLFATNRAPCFGDKGTGEKGLSLWVNTDVQSKSDAGLVDFMLPAVLEKTIQLHRS